MPFNRIISPRKYGSYTSKPYVRRLRDAAFAQRCPAVNTGARQTGSGNQADIAGTGDKQRVAPSIPYWLLNGRSRPAR
jgi:hypothetical protein